MLFAAWAIVLDAATHGWDDLLIPIRSLTIAVLLAPLAIVVAAYGDQANGGSARRGP